MFFLKKSMLKNTNHFPECSCGYSEVACHDLSFVEVNRGDATNKAIVKYRFVNMNF
jgi:hypothetical protein